MAYRLSKNTKTITCLNEEAKVELLQITFKGSPLLMPDNSYYNSFACKNDMEIMAHKLMEGLRISKKDLDFNFTHNIKTAGVCDLSKKPARILLHVKYMGKPYQGSAVLLHLLSHFFLMTHEKIIFDDSNENEKFADMVTIYSGLGLIIINGTSASGWRSSLQYATKRLSLPGLGFYSPRTYGELLNSYLKQRKYKNEQVANYVMPWSRKVLKLRHIKLDPKRPSSVRSAEHANRISKIRFVANGFFLFSFIFALGYLISQKPLFLDDKMIEQKHKLTKLRQAYDSCANMINNKYSDYDKTELSVQRAMDAKRTHCKSLENRYNHEAEIYNRMLK